MFTKLIVAKLLWKLTSAYSLPCIAHAALSTPTFVDRKRGLFPLPSPSWTLSIMPRQLVRLVLGNNRTSNREY